MEYKFCGVSFRVITLIVLYLNLIWNAFVIVAYLNAFSECGRFTDDEIDFTMIISIVLIEVIVYLITVVTIHKRKTSMLSCTIAVLLYGAFFLLYFYAKMIILGDLKEVWQTEVLNLISDLSENSQKIILEEQNFIMYVILSGPLGFKFLSALILYKFKIESRKIRYGTIAPFSSSPPPYNSCVMQYDLDALRPPSYSECDIKLAPLPVYSITS